MIFALHTNTPRRWYCLHCQELEVCIVSCVSLPCWWSPPVKRGGAAVIILTLCMRNWKEGMKRELILIECALCQVLLLFVTVNLLRSLNANPHVHRRKLRLWDVRGLAQGPMTSGSWGFNLPCEAYILSITKAQAFQSTLPGATVCPFQSLALAASLMFSVSIWRKPKLVVKYFLHSNIWDALC